MTSKADRGRALRFIISANGWIGPNDPEEYESTYNEDVKKLTELLDEVRKDERHLVSKELSKEANKIFSHQRQQDYPSNILDRVSLYLSGYTRALEVRPERISRCKKQNIKCSGCLDCQPSKT